MRQHTFIKRELINKGWSGDKKYCIFDTGSLDADRTY